MSYIVIITLQLGSLPDHLGQRLSKADLGTRLIAFAANLGDFADRKRKENVAITVFTNVNSLYVDLERRLERTFLFGDEQNVRDLVFLLLSFH